MNIDRPRPAWVGLPELRDDLQRYLSSRCHDPHAVDDAVQESLVRAARFRARQTKPGGLRSWLLRIGTNVLADQTRGERRHLARREHESSVFEVPSEEPAPEEQCDEAEVWLGGRCLRLGRARRAVQDALRALPAHDRTALLGFYVDGLGRTEVARRLGVEPRMVKVRLFRAKNRLRRALETHGEVVA